MTKQSDASRTQGARGGDQRTDSAEKALAARKCKVCEWQGEIVERPGEVVDCPWCHGPTELLRGTPTPVPVAGKNPHATALGRLGGLKGGPARAAILTAKRRRAIASMAAKARWSKAKRSKS